jgi:osmotically-inducible protein OsmY
MKHLSFKTVLLGLLITSGISFTSCKGKDKDTGTSADTSTTTTAPVTPAPVEITADDSLRTGVADATKDYPTVKAEVNNGEITLTGELQRSKLQDLMQSLQSLRPKKVNNQLTLK